MDNSPIDIRLGWIPVVLLAAGGLFILLFPLPAPGVCFWAWGEPRIGLMNCAWNTSRDDAREFLLPALLGVGLLVGAVWTGAVVMGMRPRTASIGAIVAMFIAALLALVAFAASVDLGGQAIGLLS